MNRRIAKSLATALQCVKYKVMTSNNSKSILHVLLGDY